MASTKPIRSLTGLMRAMKLWGRIAYDYHGPKAQAFTPNGTYTIDLSIFLKARDRKLIRRLRCWIPTQERYMLSKKGYQLLREKKL